LVIETSRPIAQVAKELGIVEGMLGNWVNAYRRVLDPDHAILFHGHVVVVDHLPGSVQQRSWLGTLLPSVRTSAFQ
jgi:hypothetical protein